MKTYIAQWKNGEEEFEDVRDAVDFAEKKSMETESNAYVWGAIDGIRDDEPFYSCTWSW